MIPEDYYGTETESGQRETGGQRTAVNLDREANFKCFGEGRTVQKERAQTYFYPNVPYYKISMRQYSTYKH